jgi:phosphoglycerol transferase
MWEAPSRTSDPADLQLTATSNNDSRPRHRVLCTLACYGGATILSVLLMISTLHLSGVDLSIPFDQTGDALLCHIWIKTVTDHGWHLHNASLGMPTGLDMHDFPLVDNVHFLIIKVIGLFARNSAMTFNLFYLVTFPLATLSALFVMRRLGVSAGIAVVMSLLYSFLPYHFQHGIWHVFLSAYYLVPFLVLVALRVYQGWVPFRRTCPGSGARRWHWTDPSGLGAIAVCVLMAGGGIYYAAFGCFFLMAAGVGAWLSGRKLAGLLTGLFLTGVLVLAVVANVLPNLLYRLEHGPNPEAVIRWPWQADVYGLRITQMLLPVTGHRWARAAWIKDTFNAHFKWFVNENDMATLGLVASLGFLGLVGHFLWRRSAADGPRLVDGLAYLTVCGVLLAEVGGFGTLMSFFCGTWIRASTRVSIFLAFFALLAVALLLQRLTDRFARFRLAKGAAVLLLGEVLVIGMLDQTTRFFAPLERFEPHYERVKQEYQDDAEFVEQIQAAVPEQTSIFQLPYISYPETSPVLGIDYYEPVRPYLHSRTLRWSYAAMRGREADLWQRRVVTEPPQQMVRTLCFAGFGGIWVDRAGYADRGRSLEAEFTKATGAPPLVNRKERWAFFNLAPAERALRQQYSADEWETQRRLALNLPVIWRPGFAQPEQSPQGKWLRWCGRAGEVQLTNPLDRPRAVTLRMTCFLPADPAAQLQITSAFFSHDLTIDTQGQEVAHEVMLPPGRHAIHFRCDGPQRQAPGDVREVVFGVRDFQYSEHD